ncbi:hypothetical protein [Allorhodopirellula heiligendammensis]|uniref:Uncharacterized protein n=1 Tax=Allorhodopirellula heiligendammensis TaxID=2714739 RepID=A0A5C6BWN8_9BACT|nr:hypothetical protein [Allorhodopirellula heiligendammensis]TWU16690.1 hypothetical protein Poly21_38950 [Allorhodopirellula heiligendammensis]
MTRNKQHDICKKLCDTIGIDAILAALPQHSIKETLGLVSIKEIADQLSVPYETLRSRMDAGQIPFPEMRLNHRFLFMNRCKTVLPTLDKFMEGLSAKFICDRSVESAQTGSQDIQNGFLLKGVLPQRCGIDPQTDGSKASRGC